MIRRILKFSTWTFVGLIATGVLLHAVGFRLQLDGGGTPNVVRVRSEEDRAEEIARHRAAQRAAAPAPVARRQRQWRWPALRRRSQQSCRMRQLLENSDSSRIACRRATGQTSAAPRATATIRSGRSAPTGPGGLRPLWKQPIGGGYASFVDRRRPRVHDRAARRPAKSSPPTTSLTGRELWTTSGRPRSASPWAATVRARRPTGHDGRLYALGAEGELRALDAATGKMLWRRTSSTTPAPRTSSGAWRRRR